MERRIASADFYERCRQERYIQDACHPYQRDKQMRAKFAEVQAEVAEVRAKVDDRMDALDQKLFAELAELKALLVDKEE